MTTWVSIGVCLAAFLALLWLLRKDRLSLGLPVAYLISLLLIHLPGAYAYASSEGVFGSASTDTGIRITAFGVIAFVLGVWLARHFYRRQRPTLATRVGNGPVTPPGLPGPRFWMFCLIGGWFLIYGVSALVQIPSLGAAVDKGGAIWILGVMLGLKDAIRRRHWSAAAFWGSMTFVYPVLMLLLGGFLSYGSTAVIVVFSILTVLSRRFWRMIAMLVLVAVVGLTVFVNYFASRNDIRDAVWGGASMSQRLDVVEGVVMQTRWFSAKNPRHLDALDKRLNQNHFVGVAAERLDLKQVEYLRGKSVWEGVISLIPRVLWPEKPIRSGSGDIVSDMTGLNLNRNTSWGVGNVMEFYINFGMPGVIGGFLILGMLIGGLDRRTVDALRSGRPGDAFVYFLPCLALIQPNGSLVELTAGAAAGLVAALGWRYAWVAWNRRQQRRARARVRPAMSRRTALPRP